MWAEEEEERRGVGSPWGFIVVMGVGVNDVMIGSRKRKTTKFPTTKMFMRHTMRQNTGGEAGICRSPCSEDGRRMMDEGRGKEKKGPNVIKVKKTGKQRKKRKGGETARNQPTQINPAAKVKSNEK